MTGNVKCPLCQSRVSTETHRNAHNIIHISDHSPCGSFAFDQREEGMFLNGTGGWDVRNLGRLAGLLAERQLRNTRAPTCLLVFGPNALPEIPACEARRADELVANWPATFADRLNRSFCNLARYSREEIGKHIDYTNQTMYWLRFFCKSEDECKYFIKAMEKRRWVRIVATASKTPTVCIEPEGWEHYDALASGLGHERNPIFVAMWFGKTQCSGAGDRTAEMNELYENSIAGACRGAGWRVKRADTDEHNDPIMDRVIADIRMAPFVIADLTENNNGVYYEAGFAKSFGREVIYCVPQGAKVHFDLSAVNQVRYSDKEELGKRLGDRILGSCGSGPYLTTDVTSASR